MKTLLKIVGAVVVVAVLAFAGWQYQQMRRAKNAGLISEDITHDGSTWKADFTASIPAPEETVFNAIRDVEKTHNDRLKAVRIVSQTENTKTVQMDFAGFGGQTQTLQLEFKYLPAEHKIVYRTVDNPMVDTHAEYDLSEIPGGTNIQCHETAKMLAEVPAPDNVVKQVIRGLFVAQLESLKKSLNIASTDEADAGDEEPVFPQSN
ncbi:MAG TPA: SRPBCC family protein [Candidatus Binataceae bacterium]|nr:SRPBCC family protein [Candidatus Binataceae bacterium]